MEDFSLPNFSSPGTAVTKRVETPLLSSAAQDVECDEDGGILHFEGDIVLREASDIGLLRRLHNVFTYGHGVSSHDFLWRTGIIPYKVDDDLRDLVRGAIDHWHANTPLQFIDWSGEFSYVSFKSDTVNRSPVGRQGDKQVVSLVVGTTLGWAIHEIGHAVGLWHEHSRSDQEQHIVVHRENIKPGEGKHFDVQLENAERIGDYDYESAMHYPEDAFALPGTKTISRIDGQPLGPREGLSAGDIAACKALYPNLNWS